MLSVPTPILYACMILFGGALLCLLLEVAGTGEGFRKSGKKPHIALVAFLCSTGVGIYFLVADHAWKKGAGLAHDALANAAIILSCIIALFCILLAIPQMRHMDRDRGEGYALLLVSLALSTAICVADDLLHLTVCASLWTMIMVAFSAFRSSRRVTSEIGAKLIVGACFWFLLMAFATSLAFFTLQTTQFDALARATTGETASLGKLTWSFVWIGALSFASIAPFFWFNVDYLDGAPSFASVAFAAGSFISGGVVLLRLTHATHQVQALSGELLHLLWLFAALSLIVPGFLALDQRRVGRVCVYLLVAQPGLLLFAALCMPNLITSDPRVFFMLFTNIAIVLLGVISGLSFWKHATNSEKTWEDYAGAGRKHPFTAIAWLVVLSSLVGIPGTLGFTIRMMIVQNAFATNRIWIGFVMAATIVIGAVPVTRLAIFLFAKPVHFELAKHHRPRQTSIVVICGAAIVVGGIMPQILFNLFAI